MAKTLKKLDNGLRIKYLIRQKKYYLFSGQHNITIYGLFTKNGFETFEECEETGKTLKHFPVGRLENNWS